MLLQRKVHKSSEASVVDNNPYYPYNQKLFGHDEDSTADLGENWFL